MPQESQLAHRVLTNLALPYQTNTSPTGTDPHFIAGSFDILTSINGYAERRPGFSTNVEPTPTTFNNLQRLFPWDRFDGNFYIMACDINAAGFAVVYKFQVGVDSSFSAIYTEPTATNTPYDFVVSNNTVYFSNGVYVRKWDPVNGVSNWGIAPYSTTATQTINGASTGASVSTGTWTGTAWSNPTDATGTGTPPYATVAIPFGAVFTQLLELTNYVTFTIPLGNTISQISISATLSYSGAISGWFPLVNAILLQNGVPIGLTTAPIAPTTTPTTFNIIMPNVSITGWSPTNVNNNTFGIAFTAFSQGTVGTPTGTATIIVRSCGITVTSLGGPLVTFSGTGLTASFGYQYVICYYNANTGHVGSPCPPSNKVVPANQGMSIPVVASPDPQVTNIRIFRTTDSATGLGGQAYFEIQNSPVPNANASIIDTTPDSSLNALSIAPTPTFNDPPIPMQGLVYFSGRIWGFKNTQANGNKVWFTGLEEITIGVPEECMPSGIAGNFWSFDEPVQALGVGGIGSNQGLAIFCGGRLYGIQGNTLDTFVRFQVSNRRGARNRTCTSTLGGMLAWLDSANQVWATDGTNLNELTPMIRNDLATIVQANCCVSFHTAGRFHWLVLSTGTRLYVYDVDQDQWMPPWTFSAKYIYSGEISPGNYVLLASNGTKALQLNPVMVPGNFNDNGVTYQPVMKFGLLSVVPDYGTRFSYIGVGSYNEPTRTGYPAVFQVTNSGNPIADFLICQDDDPTLATYTSIATNVQDTAVTYNRANGSFMKQYVFPTTQPASRWIGMEIKLANADQIDREYEVFMAYKSLGGR